MYVPGARRFGSAFSLVSTCTGDVMLAWNRRARELWTYTGSRTNESDTAPRTLLVYNRAVFSTSVQVDKDICDRGEADIG